MQNPRLFGVIIKCVGRVRLCFAHDGQNFSFLWMFGHAAGEGGGAERAVLMSTQHIQSGGLCRGTTR